MLSKLIVSRDRDVGTEPMRTSLAEGKGDPIARVFRVLVLLGCLVLYLLFVEMRVTIPGSDLTRVVEEFSAIGMSEYNWREPLYWATGKILTGILGDAWVSIIALDLVGLCCLSLALRKYTVPTPFIIALFFSPLFVLGINNIHRQLIGFAVWLLVERETLDRGPYKVFYLHIIPFLVHTSMGILSLIYFICYSVIRRDFFILFSIIFVSAFFTGFFASDLSELFREGTDVSTSIGVYVAWSLVLGIPMMLAARNEGFMILFYGLGFVASTGLFILSGGSSGSRFFVMFITVVAIWVVSRVLALTKRKGTAYFITLYMISVLIVAPTFFNNFSFEMLRSAVMRVQFGMDY